MHEYDAVKFIFDKVLNKTRNLNTGSVISIHLVMGEASGDGKIICPYCGSFGAKILSGEEFYLEAIEMDHS